MIDAGISGKKIEEGMNHFDMTTPDMDALLLTHEHADHVKGVGVLSRRYHIPIYATQGTIDAIAMDHRLGTIDPSLYHVIQADEDFAIGDMIVHPFHIEHDAVDPVGYVLRHETADGEQKVGVCTDLGCYDSYIISNLSDLDAVLLEANHDVRMLEVGPYPYPLKQRILGDHGHLSNETSGQLLGQVLHDDMKHVLLGHLSKENNYEDLAFKTVQLEVSEGENPYKGTDFPIDIAHRNAPSVRVVV